MCVCIYTKCITYMNMWLNLVEIFLHFNQNQKGDISTQTGGSWKLEDKFTDLRSSVSSTENLINTLLAKAWSATDIEVKPI